MTIDSFAEGPTEEKVLQRLEQVFGEEIRNFSCNGKDQVNKKLMDILGPLLGQQPIRCLILRDLDTHDGETVERIVQSVTDVLQRLVRKRGFDVAVNLSPHPDCDNIFTLWIEQPDLRLVLHIANFRWDSTFIKSTIDDYILALALEPPIVAHLARSLPIEPDKLINKITRELPDLLHTNGIPLTEAKDYVRLYAAVIRSHTSPPVFAQKTLDAAEEVALRVRFAPLLTAFDFLRSQ